MRETARTTVVALLIVLVIALTACGPAAEPTAADPATDDTAAEPTDAPVETDEATAPAAEEDAATEEMTGEATEAATDEVTEAAPAAEATTFVIVADESEARFVIDEVLTGVETTVVGATNAVEGQLTADFANPQQSSIGTIIIDLSTLATDNNFRNRALRDAILETGNPDNQYAEFNATEISGLPESVTMGEPFDFQITGDLTIHGVTKSVTFDATATPVSEERIEGSASLTIPYEEFVVIPRLPQQVASVSEDVRLEFDFVAVPAQ